MESTMLKCSEFAAVFRHKIHKIYIHFRTGSSHIKTFYFPNKGPYHKAPTAIGTNPDPKMANQLNVNILNFVLIPANI